MRISTSLAVVFVVIACGSLDSVDENPDDPGSGPEEDFSSTDMPSTEMPSDMPPSDMPKDAGVDTLGPDAANTEPGCSP
jgi:hypothetical protein